MKQLFFLVLTITLSGALYAQVKIEKINYNGWDNAIEMTNPEVKLVVVPQIGRIIYFAYLGDENLLYENPALEGQVFSAENPYREEGKMSHAGFGGCRIWPTVQDSFVVYNGDRGLSDPWIDGSPWNYELLPNGVKITSRISEYLGVQVSRSITLDPKTASVSIKQEMKKVKPGRFDRETPCAVTLWSLSKIKNPEIGLLPLRKNSVFENGIDFQKWPDNINSAPKNYSQHGNVGQLIPVPNLFQKMGTDSKGFVAGVKTNLVFGQFFHFDENQSYPDGGTSATIFTCTDFTELECLSPEKKLKVGESIRFDIRWELHKLTGRNLNQRRTEAVRWLDAQLQ